MNSQESQHSPGSRYERWTCPDHDSPVLLAMVDGNGHLQIKARNRIWLVSDYTTVTATCPKCGKRHTRRISEE